MFKRFQREARALQKLAHPNIVPFYGLYQTMDMAFMLERFVDGPSLKDVLKGNKGKPLTTDETLTYIKALSAALGYAHANGVVHCDVKPGNVMIDRGGSIYLTDFGIARHAESATTTFAAAGTAAYMPPEQIKGEMVSPATDVYALGVILYEMVTGKRPFRGGAMGTSQSESGATLNIRIREEQLHVPAPNPRDYVPTIAPELAEVILISLNKKAEDRFASAPAFFEAVCRAMKVDPLSVKEHVILSGVAAETDGGTDETLLNPVNPIEPGKPIANRIPAWAMGLAALAVLGCVVLVGALVLLRGNAKGGLFGGPSPTATVRPTSTRIATRTSAPATNTPDYAVRTAVAALTKAAAIPAATNTPVGPKCPGMEIQKYTGSNGQYLKICGAGKEYTMGPLGDGTFAVGPNQKFFVYVTFDGLVFAARVGNDRPTQIGEVKRLTMIHVDDNPQFTFQFNGNHPYTVTIFEYWEHQDMTIAIPRWITSPQDN